MQRRHQWPRALPVPAATRAAATAATAVAGDEVWVKLDVPPAPSSGDTDVSSDEDEEQQEGDEDEDDSDGPNAMTDDDVDAFGDESDCGDADCGGTAAQIAELGSLAEE